MKNPKLHTTIWLRLALLATGIVVTAGTSYGWPLDHSDRAIANVTTDRLAYALSAIGELAETTTVTVAELKGVFTKAQVVMDKAEMTASNANVLISEIRKSQQEFHDGIVNFFTKWGGWIAGILAGLRYGFSDKTVHDDVQSVRKLIKPKPQGDGGTP